VKKILQNPLARLACWYLALFLSGFALVPAGVNAAFISSSEANLVEVDADVLSEVRAALEDDLLAERLGALGLSSGEIKDRLDALSTSEREAVLEDLDRIQSGGDGAGTLISLAVLVLLIILIIKLLDKEIIIK
jgi:hypothetical protein